MRDPNNRLGGETTPAVSRQGLSILESTHPHVITSPSPTHHVHTHPSTHPPPSIPASTDLSIQPFISLPALPCTCLPAHPPAKPHPAPSVCLSTSQPSVYSTHPRSCFFHQSSDPSVLESGAQELVPAFPRNTGRSPCPGGSRYSGAFRGGNGKMGKFSFRLS